MFFSGTGQISQNGAAVGAAQQSSHHAVSEICIIGDGADALAMANNVAAHKVVIFADGVVSPFPSLEELQVRDYEVRERGAQVGSSRGNTRTDLKNIDRIDEIRNAEGIVISTDVTKYGATIKTISSSLRDGQTICLSNAPLGAALEFKYQLRKNGVKRQLNIIETGKLYDSARVESGVLLISGMRSKVSVSGLERNETRRGLAVATAVAGGIVPFSNVIERGLADAERILRPAILLSALMAGDTQSAVLSPATIKLLNALDREVQGVAKNFQCVVPGFTRSLTDYSLSEGSALRSKPQTLEAAVQALGAGLIGQCANSPKAFTNLMVEDIKESLTLIADMGVLSHSPIGIISSVIEMASVIVEEDLNRRGRKLSSLGLVGFDTNEICDMVNA